MFIKVKNSRDSASLLDDRHILKPTTQSKLKENVRLKVSQSMQRLVST
jgi:hypothetical protein